VTATREQRAPGSPARYLWAALLACLFESLPLTCPNCGADMRSVPFNTQAATVERILAQIGEPRRPLRLPFRDCEQARLAARVVNVRFI
jgi:hypothetical protein